MKARVLSDLLHLKICLPQQMRREIEFIECVINVRMTHLHDSPE